MKRGWWTALFVALVGAFVLADWMRATPHDRFSEPPPWALGQEKSDSGAHCSAAPAPRR
jgi:hypothetical protein